MLWPRHTGRAKRWAPTRETPVLRSQARAKHLSSRFFQAGLARKHRSTGPECIFQASQMSQTHLKHHKVRFSSRALRSPQRTVATKTSSNIAKLDRRLRLRPRSRCAASLVTQIASRPKGTVLAMKWAHMGARAKCKTIAISYLKIRAVAWHKTAHAKNIKVVPRSIPVIATNIMVVSRNITVIATNIMVVSPGIMAVTANMTVVSQNKGIR